MSYDIKFRQQVLRTREEKGWSFEQAGKHFGVGKQTVYNWSKRVEAVKRRVKPTTKIDMGDLKADIERYPDAYQYERAARFGVSQMGIWYALKRLGVTYKKKSQASESGCRKKIYVLPAD